MRKGTIFFLILVFTFISVRAQMNFQADQKGTGLLRHDNQTNINFKTDYQSSFKEQQEILKNESMKLNDLSKLQIVSEGIIDSNYILGPGDLCGLFIPIIYDNIITTTVNVDGNLIVPGIGACKIGGLTYQGAREKILDFISKHVKQGSNNFTVISPRKIRVYLTGEVYNPGSYVIDATGRLATLLSMAGGGLSGADLKKVVIRGKTGVDTVDYEEFLFMGLPEGNPNLSDGAIVYIPLIQLTDKKICIKGVSKYNGFYNLYKGENIRSLVRRVGVITEEANIQNVYIYSEDTLLTLSPDDQSYQLKDNDVVYISQSNEYIYVSGHVAFPGSYPFIAGLTARDYLGMAGGVQASGVKGNIVFRRGNVSEKHETDEFNRPLLPGDQIIVKEKLLNLFKEYISIISATSGVILTYFAATK